MYKIKCISSLNKVFPWQEPKEDLTGIKLSAFQNEVLSFQCAYYGEAEDPQDVLLDIESDIMEHMELRNIILMPSRYPCGVERDDNYLDTRPGLYPDLLRVNKEKKVQVIPGEWSSVWIDVILDEQVKHGEYDVTLTLVGEEKEVLAKTRISICVYEGKLQEQTLKHTEWFHADCLADYYHVKVWSEEHWRILENFFEVYRKRGINTILTPIFTPALDIAVGGERTTVQLVDVIWQDGTYAFDFDKLGRWIKLCKKYHIEYFEMAHLYTQWGAKCAPKIIGMVDGKERQIFGWDTAATDESYKKFLAVFLPELTAYLKQIGIAQQVYFHISDEPSHEHIDNYLQAKKQVEEYVEGFPIIDALSRYAFYESGAVNHPIPGINHLDEFLEKKVPGLWAYYCNSQRVDMSNRFFCMPLARTRILGVQLYKFNIEGFLHWGFNFYNTQFSLQSINPYEVTDAGCHFPSGDSFVVYPGKGGYPEESIRLMALSEAMQDIRALQTLEKFTSKEYVIGLLEEDLDTPITFACYPKESEYLLKMRQKINLEISNHIKRCNDDRQIRQ